MLGLLSLVIAYVLGAIPFGYLLVKFTKGTDVRSSGSGNIGATNVMRTSGRGIGVATLVLDIAKGYFAVWIAAKLTHSLPNSLPNDDAPLWTSLAALMVMAGHAFPAFLGFKGGKAVASFVGAFLFLTPLPLLGVTILFIAIVVSTHYISAASTICAAAFPFGVWMIMHPAWQITLASFVAGAFIVSRHQSNLQRLRAGTEHRFTWKKP